jgi:hypothetical protein
VGSSGIGGLLGREGVLGLGPVVPEVRRQSRDDLPELERLGRDVLLAAAVAFLLSFLLLVRLFLLLRLVRVFGAPAPAEPPSRQNVSRAASRPTTTPAAIAMTGARFGWTTQNCVPRNARDMSISASVCCSAADRENETDTSKLWLGAKCVGTDASLGAWIVSRNGTTVGSSRVRAKKEADGEITTVGPTTVAAEAREPRTRSGSRNTPDSTTSVTNARVGPTLIEPCAIIDAPMRALGDSAELAAAIIVRSPWIVCQTSPERRNVPDACSVLDIVNGSVADTRLVPRADHD